MAWWTMGRLSGWKWNPVAYLPQASSGSSTRKQRTSSLVPFLPEGLGRKIEPGTLLLLNLHYDMTAGDGQDQSSVQFMLEDSVDHEVTALALMHPLWLYGESMAVPGDSEETSYGFSWDPSKFYGWKTYDVWGAFFHMHELGQSGSIAILDARVPAPPR